MLGSAIGQSIQRFAIAGAVHLKSYCECVEDKKEKKQEEDEPQESGALSFLSRAFNKIVDGTLGYIGRRLRSSHVFYVAAAFAPFLGFIDDKSGATQKKTASELNTLLVDVKQKIDTSGLMRKRLSSESKEMLDRLASTVSKLNERADLKDVDLSNKILEWRTNEKTIQLLKMVEELKNNRCGKINDEEFKKLFIEVGEALTASLEETLKHPPSPERNKALEKQLEIAEPLTEAYEIAKEKGTEAPEVRQEIAERLNEVKERTEEFVNDPVLSKYAGSALSRLQRVISLIKSFLSDWFDEEEKVRKEELCKKRDKEKDELKKIIARKRYVKSRKNYFYDLMESIKLNLRKLYVDREALNRKNSLHHSKINNDLSETLKNLSYNQKQYRAECFSERFYRSKCDDIRNQLPPYYVCDHISPYNLELDLIC